MLKIIEAVGFFCKLSAEPMSLIIIPILSEEI
jgi:hypothetical protein